MGATAVHTLFSGQVKGCKVQQAVFVGGTCGSIHVESFNRKIKAWGVLESRLDPIRKKLVRRLLEEQDKVLRSYFAQKGGARSQGRERVHGKGRAHAHGTCGTCMREEGARGARGPGLNDHVRSRGEHGT